MGQLLKIKGVDSRLNVNILDSTSVQFTPTTVQVPNLTLTHTKRMPVHVPIPSSTLGSLLTLQMKGRWESNINVWFRFMHSQKWNCAVCYFQNRVTMICLPISTFMYLWVIYIFSGSVCIFCCNQKDKPILGYINGSQRHECRKWHFWEHINRIFSTVYA